MKASIGAPYARIVSVGSRKASRIVTNAEMCTMIDSSDEWIQQRTGITERRWVAEGETLEVLATDAARIAVERSGIEPNRIGAVILASVSHHLPTPGLAPRLATAVGAPQAAAYDISAACAGFCYGLTQADALIRVGAAEYVLVIGAEVLSEITDTSDRSTAFLFGDGAGAVVVGPSDEPAIGPAVWGGEGENWDTINMTAPWPQAGGVTPAITMDGRTVFKWATTAIAAKALEALDKAGVSPEELEVFIPHQANNRITDSMLRHLHLPEKVVVARDIMDTGNTSAASVPLAMDRLLSSGQAHSGQTALVIGFGAGLVYAGQVVTLP